MIEKILNIKFRKRQKTDGNVFVKILDHINNGGITEEIDRLQKFIAKKFNSSE